MTKIFIIPEFLGTFVSSPLQRPLKSTNDLAGYLIPLPLAKNNLSKITYGDDVTYNYYQIPNNQLSQMNKAFQGTINEDKIIHE